MVFILAGTFRGQTRLAFGGHITGFEMFCGIETVRTRAPCYCENVHFSVFTKRWISSDSPFASWFPHVGNTWDRRHVVLVCPD